MSAPVFLADRSLSAYAVGSHYVLDGVEGRHAGIVQRRRAGERVDVVDGAGTRLVCIVQESDGSDVTLDVREVRVEPASAVPIVLVQALAKGDRDERAIEAATEVGVDQVVPWQADRSVVVWRGTRAARSHSRWVATVRAAAKQSRRAWVPAVADAVATAGLCALVADVLAGGGRAIVLHEEATVRLADVVLPEPNAGAAPRVLVIVGPEGGISDAECVALRAAGAEQARLGPHVLRTSTAGPVAIALLACRLGTW